MVTDKEPAKEDRKFGLEVADRRPYGTDMFAVKLQCLSIWAARSQKWLCCRGNVGLVIEGKDQRGVKEALLEDLDLNQVLDRDVEHLSGANCSHEDLLPAFKLRPGS